VGYLQEFRLSYRAYQVLNTPLDELASLLGFDIPLTPEVDLAGIKADGAVVHWSLPEKQKHKSTLKYEIHVNGNIVDTVALQESAVTITALQPDAYHVVRVALVNSLEFSSKSAPIRFRTKSARSGDFYHIAAEGTDVDHDGVHGVMPRVKPYRGLKDITPASPDTVAPAMMRENSAGVAHKKSISGRRPSPAVLGLDVRHEPVSEDSEPAEGAETIQQLTEKLDAIRHDTDEAEKQAKEEEDEELRQKDDLIKERDELRADAADKDRANRNLKREVNIMERQNTASQNEKNKHDRLLQQKKQERQKLEEDLERWDRETAEMRAEVERIKGQKVAYLEQLARQKEELQTKLAEEATQSKSLDEEIRVKTIEIKKLDRSIKNHSPNGIEPEPNLVQQLQQDAEEDRAYHTRRHELQYQYTTAVQLLERTRTEHKWHTDYLGQVQAERRRQDELVAASAASAAREFPSPPVTSERGPRRQDSQRSRRGTGAPSTNNDSPRMGSFPPVSSSSPFGGNLTSTAFSTAPFLNIHNGMTINGPTEGMNMTDEERERLTGGAPMSPGAGADLLPADLFSGDDSNSTSDGVQPLPGLGTLPGFASLLPGLGQPPKLPGTQSAPPEQAVTFEHPGPGPASPASVSSRAPSTFASPQASQQHLPSLNSPEYLMDSDRRSVHSTRSNRAFSGNAAGSRFSSMFGIKPRVKNASMDDSAGLPALGKAQSQSMPRQDQGIPGIDSATRKRNSSISGAVFGGVLSRADNDTDDLMDGSTAEPSAQPTRRRQFTLNPFSKEGRSDGWPSSFAFGGRRPASPNRPGSTHSSELPRPSFDSSRWGVDTWPSNDAGNGARSSPLGFPTGGWNATSNAMPQQSRLFGSRHPSRRPSVQHGASGPPEDIMEDSDDDDSDALDPDTEAHLAPIGTRPPPSFGSKKSEKQAEAAQKLNPAAKNFQSFFQAMKPKGKDKAKDTGEASSSASRSPYIGSSPTSYPNNEDENSPPASRKSRDTRSMTTIESSLASSFAETGASRDSNDLARTPSYSNASDTTPGVGSVGKESFIAKMTRKSSSGKFSLPTFSKREKSRLQRESMDGTGMSTPTTGSPQLGAGTDEEDFFARGGDGGKKESGVGRSWSNVLKLSGSSSSRREKGRERERERKAGGGETPSVSGLSSAASFSEAESEGLLER